MLIFRRSRCRLHDLHRLELTRCGGRFGQRSFAERTPQSRPHFLFGIERQPFVGAHGRGPPTPRARGEVLTGRVSGSQRLWHRDLLGFDAAIGLRVALLPLRVAASQGPLRTSVSSYPRKASLCAFQPRQGWTSIGRCQMPCHRARENDWLWKSVALCPQHRDGKDCCRKDSRWVASII